MNAPPQPTRRLTLRDGLSIGFLFLTVAGLGFLFYMALRDENRQHARDLRLKAAGLVRAGKVLDAGASSNRGISYGWSEVLVEMEPARPLTCKVAKQYPPDTEVEMYCLPGEEDADAVELVEWRLGRWPLTTTRVGLLVMLGCLALACALDYRRYKHDLARNRGLPEERA
ncbi:MAG: hypothetical protein M5U26_24845 [Planctomycetota bacterium]|nr:hypothetical protein [Planctomycetota bacterium]